MNLDQANALVERIARMAYEAYERTIPRARWIAWHQTAPSRRNTFRQIAKAVLAELRPDLQFDIVQDELPMRHHAARHHRRRVPH